MNEDIAELPELPEIRIEPVKPWGFIDFRELFHYRDLLYFMVWRTIKVAYAQSVGGYAWALIQPAFQVVVFSLVFGVLLGVGADGSPYPLFTTVAVIPWTYISATLNGTSNALVANKGLLVKVYVPRLIFLLVPCVANLVSFLISIVLVIAVMFYYDTELTRQLVMLPVLFVMMLLAPLSIGLWLSSLTIRFRDFSIGMGLVLRMLIYTVPVVYASSKVPDEWRQWYILNPLVGIIEGFRSSLLGTPFMWDSLVTSIVVMLVLLVTGSVYFQRMERVIVDVI